MTNIKTQEIFKKIDLVEENLSQQIKKLSILKLTIINDKNKRSKKFYLDGMTKKEIMPILRERMKIYRKAGINPSWYYSDHFNHSIDLFIKAEKQVWKNSKEDKK